jgi:hypothetical protein
VIFHDVTQREQKWKALRLGLPTASNFHRIITPKTMQLSAEYVGYMHELLAEWITGEEIEGFESKWMLRGTELEDQAIRAYEGLSEIETEPGGFFTDDLGRWGCSPDRRVSSVGGLEVKCRLLHVQIGHILRGEADPKARAQVQGCILTTEREWWDVFSYHPSLIVPAVRVYRDEAFCKAMESALVAFSDVMSEMRLKLEKEHGPFVRPMPEEQVADRYALTEEDGERIIAAAFKGDQ